MASIKELNELSIKVKETKNFLFEQATKSFYEAAKKVMTDSPAIGAIFWTQYTPYFNDGEPCTFNLMDVVVALAPLPKDFDFQDEDDKRVTYVCCFTEEYEKECKKLAEISGSVNTWYRDRYEEVVRVRQEESLLDIKPNDVRQLTEFIAGNEELMEHLFGDNVTVVITKEGVDTLEYDSHY